MEVFRILPENMRINVMLYGLTGVGKTAFLGTAQKCDLTSPALLVDVEGGTLTLSGSEIDVVRPQNFDDIQEIYNFLAYKNSYYKSVCIDTVTEVQRNLSMGSILGTLTGGDDSLDYQDLAVYKPPDRYDWLGSREQMMKFIRAFRDLSKHQNPERRIHVFMAASEKVDEDEMAVCPSLPGTLGVQIGGFVDILARLSVQKVMIGEEQEPRDLRHMLFQTEVGPDNLSRLAKVRKPVEVDFPSEIWNPTVEKVLQLWMDRVVTKGGG